MAAQCNLLQLMLDQYKRNFIKELKCASSNQLKFKAGYLMTLDIGDRKVQQT